MNSFMKPAWRIRYVLEGYDSEDMLTSWRWEGSAGSERYLLAEPAGSDPETALGRATVTSWQPYKNDALADARRAVLDLCVVIGAAVGGLSVKPVFPAIDVQLLEGAKSTGGVGMSMSASFALTQKLSSKDKWFEAVQRVNDDSTLRADLDTFMVAKREADPAARTLNLYRIYDRYVQQLLDTQELLLPEEDVREASIQALVASLPAELSQEARARLAQSVRSALGRVRTRARIDVIHEDLSKLPESDTISKALLRRIDSRRGRVAHNPTVLEEAASDREADAMLFTIVHSLLKRGMGLQADGSSQ